MNRHEAAAALERYAILLELTDADPFRAKAYAATARLLETLSEPLDQLISENRLSQIRGIGKTTAAVITELATRGTFADFEAAEMQVPGGVFDLLRIDGLGPKKAKTLWREAGITSLTSFEEALDSGKLSGISGFGGKILEKFRVSLEFLKKQSGRHLRHHATRAAQNLRDSLRSIENVDEIFVGGSLRRGCETVRDLDVILICKPEHLDSARSALMRHSEIQITDSSGPYLVGSCGGFELEIGAHPHSEAPFRKLTLTGSKRHYKALCEFAAQKGFTLEPNSLIAHDGQAVTAGTEEDVYQALGLEPVPPALREDSDSLHRLGSHIYPLAVTKSDLRGILHVHSTASDGHHTLRELAEAMIAKGYEYLGIADHSQVAAYARGLSPDRVRTQWREIDALNSELAPFRILKGTEVDILADGRLDFDDDLLAGFDYVVASIHSGFNMTEEAATERLCKALSNPNVDILGHMTGRLLLARNGYPVNHMRVIECAARHGKAIELNSSPHRLDIDWRWLSKCAELGVPVPLCPDAHTIEGLSDIEYGIQVAAKGPLTPDSCPNTWDVERFITWCKGHDL